MNKIAVKDIKERFGIDCQIIGNQERYFTSFESIFHAKLNSLVWVSSKTANCQELIEKTEADVIICDDAIEISSNQKKNKSFIIVKNPKLVFTKIVNLIVKKTFNYGIDPKAVIHPKAEIHPETYIGPYTYVGKVVVGKRSIIHGHCYIYDHVEIGENVTIQAGVIIGADGFGFIRDDSGDWVNFPHIGGVIIQNNVEIGANTCVMRGSLGNTEIGVGSKIDCHVQIGHNVRIGRNVLVVANSVIGGSSVINDLAYVAPNAAISDVINVGKGATIGIGAVVISDIPDYAKVSVKPATVLPNLYWNKNESS